MPPFFSDDCAEHRELTLAIVIPRQLGFPHAATVVAVTNQFTDKKTDAATGETRLFVSSAERTAFNPRQWLARCRNHWSVESANHYRRDVTWREDAELGRSARRACNLALLRSALLGLLLRDSSSTSRPNQNTVTISEEPLKRGCPFSQNAFDHIMIR